MKLPAFHERIINTVLEVADEYGLALAGGYAMRAHGLTDRPSMDLDFATASETPLPIIAEAVAECYRNHGFAVHQYEITPRTGRMLITDPSNSQAVEFDLLKEALQHPPVQLTLCQVVALDDAVGLKMRALYERGLPRDFIDVAAVADRYAYRELERLCTLHSDEFSEHELVFKLESIEVMDDEAFHTYGISEEMVHRIRRLAVAWATDIKERRLEDGDLAQEGFDINEID